MRKIYLTLGLFVAITSLCYSQDLTVTGTVMDDQNQPLAGVSIVVKGTTRGTTTDFDGNYQIDADRGEILVYSYIGFSTKEMTVSSETLNVTLQESAQALENVVVIGSRNANRTATDTPVPVDVIDVAELTSSAPQVTVNEILNYAAPSFSSNTQTISDGTDHIDPASLRGLGPDQVLVLINGKRRHKTSLVNVNGTFGRGSVGSDMSAIPSNAIQRIEILRDGAAAQYGSDAIAGVINIVLKKSVNELNVGVYAGANFTSEAGPEKSVDGEKLNVELNYGVPLGEGGYVNFSGLFGLRGYTNRMQEWEGSIFNAYNAIERVADADGYDISNLLDDDITDIQMYASSVSYFDPAYVASIEGALDRTELQGILNEDYTEEELTARGQQRSDYNMRVGQSELENFQFFANMGVPMGENFEFYAFGGLGFRSGNSAGFYRLPNQSRTYTPQYINGFLPEINSKIRDYSLAAGARGKIGDAWNLDISNTFGYNSFAYKITNSNNASLGEATPLEAEAGGFNYSENTINADMSRFYEDTFEGLNIAFGAEFRMENYKINAGEEASYALYNTLGQIHNPDDAGSIIPEDFFGDLRPGGIQVFPGFRPGNEQLTQDADRTSFAGYFDAEADFTENFLAAAAVRFENYSDFGSTINGKLALRIKASENFNIRAAGQTGFRAPSLHQIYFNSTSTIFVDGIPNEVVVFSNTSAAAEAIGIEPLKEETSIGFSGGFTARVPSANLKITLDGYMVNIKDRVILSGQFGDNGDPILQAAFAGENAERAAFFVNSVDTRTSGIDIVLDQKSFFGDNGDMKLTNTLAFTFSRTEVQEVKIPDAIADAGLGDTYFDDTSRIYLESAVPTTKGALSHLFEVGKKWNFFLRNAYFGEVEEATNNLAPDVDRIYAGKIVTDLSVGYNFTENVRFSLGANNLLDVYSDVADPAFQSEGRFLYSRRSQQFGTNGRHIFARLNFKL